MNTQTSPPQPIETASPLGRVLAFIGSFCLFAPLVGLSVTVVSMVRSFAVLSHRAMPADPTTLSRSVGEALLATAIGLGISVVGALLVCIAIFAFRFTPQWLWSVLIAASLLWLFAFPIGTVIAVISIFVLIRKRHVFAPAKIA